MQGPALILSGSSRRAPPRAAHRGDRQRAGGSPSGVAAYRRDHPPWLRERVSAPPTSEFRPQFPIFEGAITNEFWPHLVAEDRRRSSPVNVVRPRWRCGRSTLTCSSPSARSPRSRAIQSWPARQQVGPELAEPESVSHGWAIACSQVGPQLMLRISRPACAAPVLDSRPVEDPHRPNGVLARVAAAATVAPATGRGDHLLRERTNVRRTQLIELTITEPLDRTCPIGPV
jgi:hypothetical protein